MEIRAATDAEFEEAVEVSCMSFRPDGHERYRAYATGDSSYRREQTRVVIDEGHVVATLRVWERTLRVGSRPVRMGGIGSVCTNPAYRGRGHGSALMNEAIAYMDGAGYAIGGLFSDVPRHFYGKLGWAPVPLSGFSLKPGPWKAAGETDWTIEPFEVDTDLEATMAIYDGYNKTQSGALVRSVDYWHSSPARVRGVLPTVVARRGGGVEGYLNYGRSGESLIVNEVAYDREHGAILQAFVNHLGTICHDGASPVTEIRGEIPHTHPLVDLIQDTCSGSLRLTGDARLMMYAIRLQELLASLLPEWQERLDGHANQLEAVDLAVSLNGQRAVITFDGQSLAVTDRDGDGAETVLGNIPASFLWRAFLGQSSWADLEPAIEARGIALSPPASNLLRAILPRREVTFWAPDHF